MLTLRPLAPPDHWRGRSRQVSHAALARQASDERRTMTRTSVTTRMPPSYEKSDFHLAFKPDASPIPPVPHKKPVVAPIPRRPATRPTFVPSPPSLSSSPSMSPDYYDSPPSPPRSLEDQVHVAYALDDINLAKMLLLRLKGLDVTSPDDPRIAAVKDEDFDFCFVPHGRLMDDESEKALKEKQKRELERLEEKRRAERMRDCERIWEQGKKRLREARAMAMRRKEAEEKRRAEECRHNASRVPPRPMSRPRISAPPPRPIVAYRLATPSSSRDQEPFVYDFMPCQTHSPPLSKPQTPSQSKSKSPFSRPLFDDSRTVAFSDVLASMQGPLFPPERRATSPLSTSSSQERRRRREVELLDSLLKVVEWEEDERRRRKGKGPEKPPMRRRGSNKSTLCAACSESSSSASTSSFSSTSSSLSSTPSRRSWLSFSSASSSASTAATTPSSSPPKWFNKPSPPRFIAPHTPTPSRLPHSCTHRTPVSLADSPLPIHAAVHPEPSHTQRHSLRTSPSNSIPTGPTSDGLTPASVVVRRISQLLDLAKGFQTAYMNATMFAISAASDSLDDPHISASFVVSVSSRKSAPSRATRRPLGPPGQRVCAADVKVFLTTSRNTSPSRLSSSPAPTTRPIPLRARTIDGDADADAPEPPHTVLPDPLPYALHFKPLPVPCRSPFRVHTHMCHTRNADGPVPWGAPAPAYHNGAVVLRVRTVENPLYLRVLALGNVVGARVYEGGVGVGRAREGAMGSGREKVLQIAYEGIGRSWLGVESVGVDERQGEGVGLLNQGQRGGAWW